MATAAGAMNWTLVVTMLGVVPCGLVVFALFGSKLWAPAVLGVLATLPGMAILSSLSANQIIGRFSGSSALAIGATFTGLGSGAFGTVTPSLTVVYTGAIVTFTGLCIMVGVVTARMGQIARMTFAFCTGVLLYCGVMTASQGLRGSEVTERLFWFAAIPFGLTFLVATPPGDIEQRSSTYDQGGSGSGSLRKLDG